MTEMHAKFIDRTQREDEDIRAIDPEEGITSYQTAHAWEESQAEGDRLDETEDTER